MFNSSCEPTRPTAHLREGIDPLRNTPCLGKTLDKARGLASSSLGHKLSKWNELKTVKPQAGAGRGSVSKHGALALLHHASCDHAGREGKAMCISKDNTKYREKHPMGAPSPPPLIASLGYS